MEKGEKEKLLVTSNFSFSPSVLKRLVLQTRKNQGLFGKGLSGIELCFLYTALHLHVIYLYVKFEGTSFYTLEVMDKNPKLQFTKGNNSKKRWNRVMVLVQCTPPQCDLSVYEV